MFVPIISIITLRTNEVSIFIYNKAGRIGVLYPVLITVVKEFIASRLIKFKVPSINA
jgi:hypothetical protein